MFLSFYTFIIISIVQVTDSVNVINKYQRYEPLRNKETLQRISNNVEQIPKNKRANEHLDEAKLFESIQEVSKEPESTSKHSLGNDKDDILCELKAILQKLLKILDRLEKNKVNTRSRPSTVSPLQLSKGLPHSVKLKNQNKITLTRLPRWGTWTTWSACSVTCGKGREIRWRHCVEECENAETEMEEKACQLPACGPGKLFGIQL